MQEVLEKIERLERMCKRINKGGNETTVFYHFSGHTAQFGVVCYENGWNEHNKPNQGFTIYLDSEDFAKEYKKCKEYLMELFCMGEGI